MDIKNEVLSRVYILLFGFILPAAAILFYRTVDIAVLQGDRWRERGKDLYIAPRPVEPERGNIMARDGSLLATSIPYFDIYMDPNSTGMSDADFMNNLDTLSHCIATYVDNKFTPGGFREFILKKKAEGARYVPIKKKVTYLQKKQIEQFPLFNLGQIQGGFIAQKSSERVRPFGLLSLRTVGYVRGDRKIGLEGAFDEILGGQPGQQFMLKVDPEQDIWIPTEDLLRIEPKNGSDILTTIDINLQDVTERALMRSVNAHNADWGTAVVMEVKTGAIAAIANLRRIDTEQGPGYYEAYNDAIASATEPGSTFKLASMMAMLEDGFVKLNDTIPIYKGRTEFYKLPLEDSNPLSFKLDSTSVRNVFAMSSNVGMATLVEQFYGSKSPRNKNKGPELFIDKLKQFNLHLPANIEIEGEAAPLIKEANSKEDGWSGTTLPWMAIGYELLQTPLQILAFYNAVANGGRMMKPYLVSEIQKLGEVQQVFKPTVIKRNIASAATIKKARELLAEVVENEWGTANKLKTSAYRFAGKTGTSQIDYQRSTNKSRVGGYQASFVGYFPAEDPRYSCIVVINNPRQLGFYGADVAGPVFREIADYCMDSQLQFRPQLDTVRAVAAAVKMPDGVIGAGVDIVALLEMLDLKTYGKPETDFWVTHVQNDSLLLERRTVPEDVVPSVVGMGLRDALFVLENKGFKVEVEGSGKVVLQSVRAGTPARGQTVKLTLG